MTFERRTDDRGTEPVVVAAIVASRRKPGTQWIAIALSSAVAALVVVLLGYAYALFWALRVFRYFA